MAAAGPVLESLQRLDAMMEYFGDSLPFLCKGNGNESAVDLWKSVMEYCHDLHKALQSSYETLEIKEIKPELEALKIEEEKPEEPGTRGKNKENNTSKVTVSSPASPSFSKVLSSVEVRPEIKALCDKADGCGLLNYIVDNMKEVQTLRNELTVALSKASDAANLVLKALEGYDFSKSGSNQREDYKSSCSVNRSACILLLESLFPVFGNDENGVVPSDVKDSAREIAKVWRKEMKIDENLGFVGQLDVQAFLQLLGTFRIAANYEEEELWRLVRVIQLVKQTPELCRSLGLSSRIPALVRKLFRTTPITALRYAHVCGVMDKVDPVGLLTSYLRNAEEGAKALLTNGHGSVDSQTRANQKMLHFLKNAIIVIKEYGLQSHFCEDDLQNKLRILVQEHEELKKNRKQAAKRKTQEKEDTEKATEKKAQEEIDRNKAAEKKAQEEKDRNKAAEKKAQEKEDGEKSTEKKAQETEDRKKAAEKSLQHKRRQSFQPGYGPSVRENYVSKRAKHASPNMTTIVAGGMGNSKASPYNIDGVQKKSWMVGYDHHTSAFSAANTSSTGLVAVALTSAPSTAAQINDERRRHPSAFGTGNLTPIGSSLYGSSVPTGAFAVPLYNVAEVNYDGRVKQSYTRNPGEVDKNHVRASVYGTGDLAKSSASQGNYNYEGRGQQSNKLNFGVVGSNPVSTSAYGTRVLSNSSATQSHYERRVPELYTSAFGGGNIGSIGSSVYGSNSRTIPSDVSQGGRERSLGQYLDFAGRNMVPFEPSGYGPGVSTVPPSNVTQGHFESRSVTDRYRFNNGLTSLHPAY